MDKKQEVKKALERKYDCPACTPKVAGAEPDDNLLLSDEAIRESLKEAMRSGQDYGDDGEPLPAKKVARNQMYRSQEHKQKVVAEIFGEIDSRIQLMNDEVDESPIGNRMFRNAIMGTWILALKAKYVKER